MNGDGDIWRFGDSAEEFNDVYRMNHMNDGNTAKARGI